MNARATDQHNDQDAAVGCIGIPMLVVVIGIAAFAWSQVFA